MNHILKVFSSGADQEALAQDYKVLARYDAFVLIEVPAKTAKSIAKTHLAEDITSQYTIETGGGVIDTSSAGVDRLSGPARTVCSLSVYMRWRIGLLGSV